MIKATVSITKKKPGAEEYSSDMFHAGIEVELPDSVFTSGNGDLREAMSRLFREVRSEVDSQINGNGTTHETPPRGAQEACEVPAKAGDAPVSPNRAMEQRLAPSGGGSNGHSPPAQNGNGQNGADVNGNGRAGNGDSGNKPANGAVNGDKASAKQVGYLISLGTREAKMSFPELRAYVQKQTGKTDVYALSKAEASAVIDSLKAG